MIEIKKNIYSFNSKVISKDKDNEVEVTADNLEYHKLQTFICCENVIIEDKLAKIKILTDKAVYKKFRNILYIGKISCQMNQL